MTNPMVSISGPKYVSTTSPINEKSVKTNQSPPRGKTDPINTIRSDSIETGEHQNSKFKTNNAQPLKVKGMKPIQREYSERNLFPNKDNSSKANASLPFQFKVPQGKPEKNKRKREENLPVYPITNIKLAHTESTQRPSQLSEAQRDYHAEQPTFKEVNKKVNQEVAKFIFLNISPVKGVSLSEETQNEITSSERTNSQ